MLVWIAVAAFLQQEPLPLIVEGLLHASGHAAAGIELRTTTGHRSYVDGDTLWNSAYPPPRELGSQRSGGDGAFRLVLPLPLNRNWLGDEPCVSAWRGDTCVGVWLANPTELVPGNALRWTLDDDAAARVVVQDPEGKPCVGANVRVLALRVGEGCALLPSDLVSRLAATTGADGSATFACGPRRLAGIEVTTPAFGTQRIAARRDGSGLDVVQLRAAATLQLQPRGVAVPPGLTVAMWSRPLAKGGQPDREASRLQGEVRLVADRSGAFAPAAVASGSLLLRGASDGAVVGVAKPLELAPGTEATWEIEFVPTVRLTGVVQDAAGTPIANAIVLSSGFSMQWATTDAAGQFAMAVAPGSVSVTAVEVPAGYLPPAGAFFGVPHGVPAGVAEHGYPPIVLPRGEDVRGRVVDVEGGGVGGSKVTVSWSQETAFGNQRSTQTKTLHTAAGADGAFVARGLPKDKQWTWSAAFGERATRLPTTSEAGQPVELVLHGVTTAPHTLTVAVRDSKGAQLPKARIAVTQKKVDAKVMYSPQPFPVGGQTEAAVDANGKLVVAVEANARYCVLATAPGCVPVRSAWFAVGGDDVHHAVELVLPKLREVRGMVVDAAGAPAADATVFHLGEGPQATTATTDALGGFRLGGLRPGSVILFARTGSQLAFACTRGGDGTPVVISLAPRVMQAARPVAEAALSQLAMAALAPLVKTLPAAEASLRLRVLQTLAVHDPAQALALVDTVEWPEPWYPTYVKSDAAKALLPRDREEGLMVARSLALSSSQCLSFLAALDGTDLGVPERHRLVAEALMSARATETPEMKVAMLVRVAEAWSDLGDEGAAAAVLAEAKPLVDGLPSEDWAGYARCLYAEQIARVDVDAALPLVESLTDQFSRDRHYGNTAHELAGRNPTAAERVFGKLKHKERFAARVAYRMAPVDLERARRIVDGDGVEPNTRIWCHYVMAESLADKAPKVALELLESALAAAAAANLAEPAAAMLACLHRLDAKALPGAIARLLASWRPSPSDAFDDMGQTMTSRVLLALQLRPFDGEVAAALAEPAWAHAAAVACERARSGSTRLGAMLALLDPERAAAMIQAWQLPSVPTMLDESTMARLSLAKILGMPASMRMAELLKDHFMLWPIDEEDL